jgi:5-methyltetrahydrofolate--homocysteine methyltransferase
MAGASRLNFERTKMTHTLVASQKREHVIGFDRPFTVIGERINPTGRKKLAAEMVAGNFETVEKDALAQVTAGAHLLDVNAGVTAVNPNETEPALLKQTLEIVQALVDIPICIDSSVPAALKLGLETVKGRPLVNSVTGEEERLETILPLVAKYNVPVVAISNDETGISEDPDVRFEVAKKIVNRAQDYGIKPSDIVVDPLVMPIGAMGTAGQQVFRLVRRLREELKVNTTCGASNVSFGMPNRRALTGYFLAMAASHGMTSAIMNPLHDDDMHAILGANVLNGTDANCLRWIKKFRETAPPVSMTTGEGAQAPGSDIEARRREREERRRRRG